jgi:hypothetical protein
MLLLENYALITSRDLLDALEETIEKQRKKKNHQKENKFFLAAFFYLKINNQ